MASALNGNCARRSNFISVIVGSAASSSMTRFPIILRSRLIGTARFRDSDILRQVFEAVVRACMDAGLVRSEGFAVDASVIEADASRYHGKAPGELDWSAPERQTRAVAEFLTALDDEGADADRKPPTVISPVDPCSAWTAKANKRVQFGYGLNYLIDLGPHAVIVDVEGTPARTYDEVGWLEGRTVAIEYRWAEGRSERFAEIAAEFVRLKVDVIVTAGTAPALAAKQATSAVPIVFPLAGDPVGNGLVASLPRPGEHYRPVAANDRYRRQASRGSA